MKISENKPSNTNFGLNMNDVLSYTPVSNIMQEEKPKYQTTIDNMTWKTVDKVTKIFNNLIKGIENTKIKEYSETKVEGNITRTKSIPWFEVTPNPVTKCINDFLNTKQLSDSDYNKIIDKLVDHYNNKGYVIRKTILDLKKNNLIVGPEPTFLRLYFQ